MVAALAALSRSKEMNVASCSGVTASSFFGCSAGGCEFDRTPSSFIGDELAFLFTGSQKTETLLPEPFRGLNAWRWCDSWRAAGRVPCGSGRRNVLLAFFVVVLTRLWRKRPRRCICGRHG